jgi:leucyl aminopeptidase
MDIKLITGDLSKIKADALIVGIFEDGEGNEFEKDLDKAFDGAVSELRKKKEIKGKLSELTVIHSLGRIAVSKAAVLGLGKKKDLDATKLRSSVADACRNLQRKNNLELALALPDTGLSAVELGRVAAEAAYLGSYNFRKHLTKEAEYGELKSLSVISGKKLINDDFEEGTNKGEIVAQAVMLARDMGNEPSNYMTPEDVAETAKRVAKDSGLKIEILERKDMEKLGMGGLLGVSQASFEKHPPKLIIMRYNGRGGGDWDLALVGKGLTFDTGGISIKPADKMEDMKFDMCGGAATIAAMGAIAKLKYKINIIAAVPATENMPSGGAYKPGDVLKMFTGKTVEVISTDAEGRLILADVLAYSQRYKPDLIVDIATLTGSVSIALGTRIAGVLGNDQDLIDRMVAAGRSTGEPVWQLPIDDSFKEMIRGDISDYKNFAGRDGSTISAAALLGEFVGSTPWIHIDIAGTFWAQDTKIPYQTKGATGYGVDLMLRFLEGIASARKG